MTNNNSYMKMTILRSCLIIIATLTLIQTKTTAQNTIDCPFSGASADGSDCNNTIITAVPFLRIVPDARFGGMGDVGIAMPADANSMHFNASALTFAPKDFSISATFTPWLRALGLNDVFLAYLSAYKQVDYFQTIGASLRFFSLGQIQYTDDQGNPLQTVRPNEFELAIAYSRKLGKEFSVGFTPKYIFSNLGTGAVSGGQNMRPAHGFAADLSFTFRKQMQIGKQREDLKDQKNAIFTAGLAFSNIGTKVSYTQSANRDYIPANLGLGFSFEYQFDKHNSIVVGLDINKLLVPTPVRRLQYDEDGNVITDSNDKPIENPNYDADGDGVADYKQQSVPASIFSSFGDAPGGAGEEFSELMWSVGLEYWYNKQFAVRFGHYNEHKFKGNRKFFTVGLGIRYKIFNINFSYLIPSQAGQRNPLDNTLRFSVMFDFGKAPDKKKRK
ncbi:type IX secretion system outer membrane channel protein PorV [Aureispira sp. CCB-QB1]|uniref:type IX secretion system outer membrane channel protein PorV n=1 Tax=Aureispira sp. CCB-QB1 TaxID=1313421 RepID=UPI000696548D|nr:type IX secretion system outer membrane channel protein PorV [Aureispira sp. CCB-QB1]